MSEGQANPITSVALPLTGSLLLTGLLAGLICRLPARADLSLAEWAALSLGYLLAAGCAHVLAVWSVARVFPEHVELSAGKLIRGLWMASAWLPLLVLLAREHSFWLALVPALITGNAAIFLKRIRTAATAPEEDAGAGDNRPGLFRIEEEPSLARTALPAVVTSFAFQAGLGALLLGYYAAAGALIAGCTTYPLWRSAARESSLGREQQKERRGWLIAGSLAALLLTAGALLPYLGNRKVAEMAGGFLHLDQVDPILAQSALPRLGGEVPPPDSYYSGVILFLPPKPVKEIVAPAVARSATPGAVRKRSTVIPFDGAYWYFRFPDRRPKPDARVVRGDPMRETIRSTNSLPLTMEAHESLMTPIATDCCSAIKVTLRNGDQGMNPIFVEIVLNNRTGKTVQSKSLGNLLIPSSMMDRANVGQKPAEESLTFPLPAGRDFRQFDEIVVVLKPGRSREQTGAHVAVEQFELIP